MAEIQTETWLPKKRTRSGRASGRDGRREGKWRMGVVWICTAGCQMQEQSARELLDIIPLENSHQSRDAFGLIQGDGLVGVYSIRTCRGRRVLDLRRRYQHYERR